MPVLIVSEKTWPHEGFSRKRSTRPSSSVTTIPNSSGFSTDLTRSPPRLVRAVRLDELGQVDVAEGVAGDDEERVVEPARRALHGAGGAQRRLLHRVADVDAERLDAAE